MNHKIVSDILSLLKEESKKFDGEISYSYISGYLLSILDNMVDRKPEVISILVKEYNGLLENKNK
jgi:hypothetical protein